MTPGANDPETIRREIEATREELGATIEALAEKTDVSAQARRRIESTKATVSEKRTEVLGRVKHVTPDAAAQAAGQATQSARQNPLPTATVAAFAAGFLLGRLTKRT